jgi:hypothetical protein
MIFIDMPRGGKLLMDMGICYQSTVGKKVSKIIRSASALQQIMVLGAFHLRGHNFQLKRRGYVLQSHCGNKNHQTSLSA